MLHMRATPRAVIPAKAGTQASHRKLNRAEDCGLRHRPAFGSLTRQWKPDWVPASAGMTKRMARVQRELSAEPSHD